MKMKRGPYVKSDIDTLSIREAKGIAGVSRTTLYTWMKENRFSYERLLNNQVLIDKESFFNYINKLKEERGKPDE